jgi:hypothetical protein
MDSVFPGQRQELAKWHADVTGSGGSIPPAAASSARGAVSLPPTDVPPQADVPSVPPPRMPSRPALAPPAAQPGPYPAAPYPAAPYPAAPSATAHGPSVFAHAQVQQSVYEAHGTGRIVLVVGLVAGVLTLLALAAFFLTR